MTRPDGGRNVTRLPLGGAAIGAMVFGFVWAFLAVLLMVFTPTGDDGEGLAVFESVGRISAICAGLFAVLLAVDTVVELLPSGRRRRIRVAVNLFALVVQIVLLYGSLEMMRAGAAAAAA